jgi:hypothetical protein
VLRANRVRAQGARAKREYLAQVPKRVDFVVSYVIEFVDRPGRPLMSVERCVCLFVLFVCLFVLFVCLFVWSLAVVLFVAGPLISVGYARRRPQSCVCVCLCAFCALSLVPLLA